MKRDNLIMLEREYKETNKYCEGKAKSGVIINQLKVCDICYYWIKQKNKGKV